MPRDDRSGQGYPGLEPVTSALGSRDGLSQYPYIRESRRIRGLETVTEQEISSFDQPGPRAANFADTVGIGFYPMDIHGCSKQDFASATKPFQIPLGALIPRQVENLLAASKDIGTTHLTNGAFRVHPIEWAIGEAAGTVAAFALSHGVTPAEIDEKRRLTQQLQLDLIGHGVPIYWFDDVKPRDPAFLAAQFLAVGGIFGSNEHNLHFDPSAPVKRRQAVPALARALGLAVRASAGSESRRDVAGAHSLRAQIRVLIRQGYLPPQFSDPSALDQNVQWSDLERAAWKLGLSSRFSSTQPGLPSRSDFAVWLESIYWRHIGPMRR